jgi:hypothetical protein
VFSMKSSEEIVAHFLEALIRYVAVQDRFHELNLSSLPKTTDSLPSPISIRQDIEFAFSNWISYTYLGSYPHR